MAIQVLQCPVFTNSGARSRRMQQQPRQKLPPFVIVRGEIYGLPLPELKKFSNKGTQTRS
jgi:hypothetical protein